MQECELLATCAFFNDRHYWVSEMTDADKERYCKGDYMWCGRYMTFKALQKEQERQGFSQRRGKGDLK